MKKTFFQSMLNVVSGWWPFGGSGEERMLPFTGAATESGAMVTPASALKLSAVWACISLRSDAMATLPLHLRYADKTVASDHPLHRLLRLAPNADMTAAEFWGMQFAGVDMWGNAYSRKHWNDRRDTVVALTPMRPERTIVRRAKNGALGYIDIDRPADVITQDDVFHIKGFTLDGINGLSPLQYAAETMGALLMANQAATREFRNGLKVGGFLKTGQTTLNDKQRSSLREALARFGLPENQGKWMILEAGMEPASAASIKVNPIDAQLLESRYFGIEEICRAFRVPPQLIGHVSKASSWASSLENTNLGFLTYSLGPQLARVEQSISRHLIRPEERAALEPKFKPEGWLRVNSAARSSFYVHMLQNGVMTRNEVRALEDLPPVEGGDVLTVQLNLAPLDQIGDTPDEAALKDWIKEITA